VPKRIHRMLIVFLLVAVAAAAAGVVRVQGFGAGSQDEATLNAGLPAAEYGYHPDEDGSWGESWSVQCVNEAGDNIVALMSISNYHPLHKFGGTVDLFYYPASGEKFEGHAEVKNDNVSANRNGVKVNIGGNRFSGNHPNYRWQTEVEGLALDLTFTAETPSLQLGQRKILFGDRGDRYWNLTVLGPRASVKGTITANGRKIPYEGRAYFDHGWSTYKLYEFSQRWHVLRMMQDDFSFNLIEMVFRENFRPKRTQAIYITLGDKIIANSGAVKLTPTGAYKHAPSGLTLPQSYRLHYEAGGTKLTGTVRMVKLVEGLNALDRLSPLLRKVIQTLVTDPWQFRFAGEADLTLVHNGQTRKITGLTGGEVHHYK